MLVLILVIVFWQFLGAVLIRSAVFSVWIPGCLPNRSGVNSGLWVLKKLSESWKNARNATHSPIDFLREFLCLSSINIFWHLSNTILLDSRRILFRSSVNSRMIFMILFVNGCKFSFNFEIRHISRKRKTISSVLRLN